MPHATQAVALVPHPATPSAARAILVDLRRERGALSLRYLLEADLERLRIPPPRGAARSDGLWRHTCFELFVSADGSPAYEELNFSPSGEWAAYAFSGYRAGGAPLDCPAPEISVRGTAGTLELDAAFACARRGALRIGLSAVVESAEGAFSYWALRHRSPQPDFHDAAAFILEVDEDGR
jgi:hypothetical protein